MRKKYSIQVNRKNHILGKTTWIMGVLNVTPDSFSDGGLYLDKDKAVQRGLEIAANGADIVDVGGESTRPGSDPISIEEEMIRIIPVISGLRKESDVLISVDTTKSEIAEAALDSGADIINDISSFQFDPQMAFLASRKEVPIVLMHMKGIPKAMQIDPTYTDLLGEVKSFLKKKINIALSSGIKKGKIIIDPGIGFGKSYKDNLTLINNLSVLEDLGCPILVGPSRKSFIGKILDMPPDNRIEGTIASTIISIMRGAHIVRVHDVASIKKAILVAEAILENEASTTTLKEKKESYVC